MLDEEAQRDLIQELVSLRQQHQDRTTLEETNNKYLQQLAQMEVQVNNLQIQVESRDAQIKKLKSNKDISVISRASTVFLEEEVRQLRPLVKLKSEIIDLTAQLQHANHLTNQYKVKYNEAVRDLTNLQIKTDENVELNYLKTTVIPGLEQIIQDKTNENQFLREKLQLNNKKIVDEDGLVITDIETISADLFCTGDEEPISYEKERKIRSHSSQPSLLHRGSSDGASGLSGFFPSLDIEIAPTMLAKTPEPSSLPPSVKANTNLLNLGLQTPSNNTISMTSFAANASVSSRKKAAAYIPSSLRPKKGPNLLPERKSQSNISQRTSAPQTTKASAATHTIARKHHIRRLSNGQQSINKMVDTNSEEYQIILCQLLSLGIDQTAAEQAIQATNASSVDAALDHAFSNPSPAAYIPPEPEPPAPSGPRIEYHPVVENPYEDIQLPQLQHNTSSQDSWGEKDDYYGEMLDDNIQYIKEKNAKNTEHIQLVHIDAEDIFTHSMLMQHIVTDLNEIAELFGISTSNASVLLREYRWNREQLTERYFDNPGRILSKLPSNALAPPPSQTLDCPICGDTFEADEMKWLPCQHSFCKDCWKYHIEEYITTGKADAIRCMQAKCPCLVVDPQWISPLITRSLMKKFVTFWVNLFVEVNPVWKSWTRPNWEYLVRADGAKDSVHCNCGLISCTRCQWEGHEPATCEEMKTWEAKSKSDGETFNWMKINTQDCPKCKWPIEKNNGCNHMTCLKCHYEFCWIWLGDYKTHGMCNGDKPKAWASKDATEKRESLEKYLHYYHRFQVHSHSSKLEAELRQKAVEQQLLMQSNAVNQQHIKMIDDATENLIECRRVLKYTYVKAFYIKNQTEKNLFEYLQGDLETAVEALSHLLEAEVGGLMLDEIRIRSNNAATRLIKLIEDTAVGLVSFQDERARAARSLVRG